MPGANRAYSQEELLSFIQKKDKKAFGILYDTYSPVLFGIITKLCADVKLAEDILHRSFIKIWQNIRFFDPGKQRLLAWMLSVSREIAEEAMRSNINKNSEIQTLMNNVLNNKEVLPLIYFKGYSLKNAAEILNISVDELKMKLKRELDQIRTVTVK